MAKGMDETERRLWGDRLRHANRVWQKHGLARSASGAHSDNMFQYIRAYRNQQMENGLGDIPPEDCVVINMVFEITNTLASTLLARHPQVDVSANDPKTQDGARIMEVLLNTLVQRRDMQIKRQVNRATRDALILPGGVVQHGFTPLEEFEDKDGKTLNPYTPAKPDFPWIKRRPLWDVRIDPLAETFDPDGDANWVAFRTLTTRERLEKNPNVTVPKDLHATVTIDTLGDLADAAEIGLSPDFGKLVEVWEVWVKDERKKFMISPGSDQLLQEPRDWPIRYEHLPYNFLAFNEQIDDPFGVAYPEVYWKLQQERNKVRTMLNAFVKRIRRLTFLDRSMLEDGEDQKIVDGSFAEFIYGKGNMREAIHDTLAGSVPIQELLLYDRQIKEDIRELTGVSEMDRAQRINVETASEANQVGQGAARQRGRNQGPLEDFMSDVIATYGKALQEVVPDEFTVPILGESDAARLRANEGEPFLRVEREAIQGEFLYQVRPGSMLPRNPGADIQKETAWLQTVQPFGEAINLQQSLLDLARAYDKDPTRALTTPEQQEATRGALEERGADPNAPQEGGSVGADLAQLVQLRDAQGAGGQQ